MLFKNLFYLNLSLHHQNYGREALLCFTEEVANLPIVTIIYEGEHSMKTIIVVILAAFFYGFVKLTLSLVKEFVEMILEAWKSGETGH